MATDPARMDQARGPHLLAVAFPRVSIFGNSPLKALHGSATLAPPAFRAFVNAVQGGLIGGSIYCLVLAWFQVDGLGLACRRAVVLSLVFGGFEMWRVARRRTLSSARSCLLWTLAATVFVLWGLGAILPASEDPRSVAPPQPVSNLRLLAS